MDYWLTCPADQRLGALIVLLAAGLPALAFGQQQVHEANRPLRQTYRMVVPEAVTVVGPAKLLLASYESPEQLEMNSVEWKVQSRSRHGINVSLSLQSTASPAATDTISFAVRHQSYLSDIHPGDQTQFASKRQQLSERHPQWDLHTTGADSLNIQLKPLVVGIRTQPSRIIETLQIVGEITELP